MNQGYTQMRDLVDQLLAATKEGTVRWQAVGFRKLHAQYGDCDVEFSVSHGYSRRPSMSSPAYSPVTKD